MHEKMSDWTTNSLNQWYTDGRNEPMNELHHRFEWAIQEEQFGQIYKTDEPSASQINSCKDLQYHNAEWLMRYVNTLKLSLEVVAVYVTDRWTICLTWRIICNTSERFNTSWWGDLDKLLKKKNNWPIDILLAWLNEAIKMNTYILFDFPT